jgi:NACHT domain
MSALFDRLDQQTQLILTALIQSEHRISQDHRRDVRTTIAQLMSRHEIFAMDEHCRTRDLSASGCKEGSASLPTFTARVEMLHVSKSDEDRTRELVQNSILESLKYAAMSNRYESLPEAHPQTFEWAFHDSNDDNDSWENLATWLKTGTGIYWIGGKPGSGKSTLMKHLYDDERTHRYLDQWARTGGTKDSPLRLATFFFWNSGSLEQRSQSGMLRSLLFQILSQQPDLIPIVFPEVWAIQYTKALYDQQDLLKWHEPWGLRRLLTAFKDALAQSMVAIKLCLLIDGLDEFDGDHEILADLFNEVAGPSKINSSIKICLSSRPWNIYRENFGHGPSLQLQSLTYKDIEKYVIDRFNANEPFQRLAKGDFQTAIKLQREIIAKAEGVFIWVYIVVRDILRSVRNRDSIPELWKRVQALPRDIEPLYDHIMSQIEPFYLPWSSRIFQIVRARLELGSTPRAKGMTGDGFTSGFAVAIDDSGGGCPSIVEICLGLDQDLDYKRVGTMSQDQLDSKCQEAEFHITARCACLLEVRNTNGDSSVSSRSLVQYLHRTARDFIEEPRRWEEVLRNTRAAAFDPYWYLMRGQSLALHRFSIEKDKFIDYPPDDQMLDTAIRILIFASYADAHVLSHREQGKILDATAQTLFKHNIDLSDWPESLNQHGIPKGLKNPFIGVALSLNLSGYISQKLRILMFQDRDQTGAKFSATYMLHQIDGSNLIAVDGLPHMSFEMASALIVRGADVNYNSPLGKTTWQWFLERNIPEDLLQGTKEGLKANPNLALLMSLFLSAGADPWVRVSVDGERGSCTITLLDYFEKYIRRHYPKDAEKLHRDITESMQSFKPRLLQEQDIGQGHSKSKISPGSVARTLNDVSNRTPESVAARANRYRRMQAWLKSAN